MLETIIIPLLPKQNTFHIYKVFKGKLKDAVSLKAIMNQLLKNHHRRGSGICCCDGVSNADISSNTNVLSVEK